MVRNYYARARRQELVGSLFERGDSIASICKQLKVSKQTVYRDISRFKKSSAPQVPLAPNTTPITPITPTITPVTPVTVGIHRPAPTSSSYMNQYLLNLANDISSRNEKVI